MVDESDSGEPLNKEACGKSGVLEDTDGSNQVTVFHPDADFLMK